MWAPSTIGINNNLSACETCISSWSTNVKFTRWVDDDFGSVKHVFWDDFLDDFLCQNIVNLLVGNIWGMLGGDQDVVNSDWLEDTLILLLILNNNLGFAIRPQPWDSSIFSINGHLLADLICKHMGVWVKGFGIPLIGGISKHESLITSSHIQLILGFVDSSSDVCILSMDINDNIAFIAIKTNIFAGEAYLSADSSGNLLEVNFALIDGYFSKKNDLKSGCKIR